MANKRKNYRVAGWISSDGLSLAILEESRALVGRIVNISRGGAAVLVENHLDFKRPEDDVLHLRLHSTWLKNPIFILGTICSQSKVEGASIYRVKFADFLDLLSKLPPELRKIFNARTAPRFENDEKMMIIVNVRLHQFRIPALLKDLTPSGMSVIIKKKLGAIRFPGKHVEASFRLPEVSYPFEFSGTVAHSRDSDEGLCWGIRFDGKSKDFRVQQDHLLQFIDRRAEPALMSSR